MFGEKDKSGSTICDWLKLSLGIYMPPTAQAKEADVAKQKRPRVDSLLEGRDQCKGFIWVHLLTDTMGYFDAGLIEEKPLLFGVQLRWSRAKSAYPNSVILRDRMSHRSDNIVELLKEIQSGIRRGYPGGYICRLNVERDEFWRAVEKGHFSDTLIDAIPAKTLKEHDMALLGGRDRSILDPIKYYQFTHSTPQLG